MLREIPVAGIGLEKLLWVGWNDFRNPLPITGNECFQLFLKTRVAVENQNNWN